MGDDQVVVSGLFREHFEGMPATSLIFLPMLTQSTARNLLYPCQLLPHKYEVTGVLDAKSCKVF